MPFLYAKAKISADFGLRLRALGLCVLNRRGGLWPRPTECGPDRNLSVGPYKGQHFSILTGVGLWQYLPMYRNIHTDGPQFDEGEDTREP